MALRIRFPSLVKYFLLYRGFFCFLISFGLFWFISIYFGLCWFVLILSSVEDFEMKLKICGIQSRRDVECVNQAQVDYAGFVFTPHRQQVDVDTARELKRALDPRIQAVGVFVDEPFAFVRQLVDSGIIDVVQFHGEREYPMPCPTIKAFCMRSAADIRPTGCDFVLFDAFKKGVRGSTGGMFDWRLLQQYDHTKPFFLAGGITADTIERAVALNPYGIDLSSGAEVDGQKSFEKIKEIALCIEKYCPR